MKNIVCKIAVAGLGLLCICCQKDDNISRPNAIITPATLHCNAGQPVTFEIKGSSDYITFWSGEKGHKYANRDKITATVNSALLGFRSAAAYGADNQPRALSIMISDDFKAKYDASGVVNQEVTWRDITPANTPNKQNDMNTYIVAEPVDLTSYAGKCFYVALRYKQEALTGSRRQVKVRDFGVTALTDEGEFSIVDINSGQFKLVKMSGPSAGWTIATDAIGQLFSCQGTTGAVAEEYWYISKELNLDRVNSDVGVAIKTITDNIENYTYTFSTPGTYKVTFETTNAGFGQSYSELQEFDVVVDDYVPEIDVQITPSTLICNVSETINFDFTGDCTNVDFWSGAKGHEYIYRDRTSVSMTDASFQFESAAAYGNVAARALSVLVSTNFSGTYSKAELQAATWDDVTPSNVPVKQIDFNNYILSKGGLIAYDGNKFHMALRYKQVGADSKRQVNVKDFAVTGTDGTQMYSIVPNVAGTSFTQIVVSGTGNNTTTGWMVSATEPKLKARSVGAGTTEEEYWLVSKRLDMNSVAPDSGVDISNDVFSLNRYSYAFSAAGTYTVTFVLTNKSDFGSVKTLNKEFTITVN